MPSYRSSKSWYLKAKWSQQRLTTQMAHSMKSTCKAMWSPGRSRLVLPLSVALVKKSKTTERVTGLWSSLLASSTLSFFWTCWSLLSQRLTRASPTTKWLMDTRKRLSKSAWCKTSCLERASSPRTPMSSSLSPKRSAATTSMKFKKRSLTGSGRSRKRSRALKKA